MLEVRDLRVVHANGYEALRSVNLTVRHGASAAEFPVTLPAARRARERGMWITVGAPNIVRGGSTSGNVSATELAAAGLADIICADYHAPSLLYAAFALVEAGVCPLPAAVAMLTATPARVFGLADRGVIAPGMRGDLCLAALDATGPEVTLVLSAGEVAYAAGLPHLHRRLQGTTGRAPARSPVPVSRARSRGRRRGRS